MDPVKAEFWRLARNYVRHGAGFDCVTYEPRAYALASFLIEHGTNKGIVTDNVVQVMEYLQDRWKRVHHAHAP